MHYNNNPDQGSLNPVSRAHAARVKRFCGRVWFRDELAKIVCKKPSQFFFFVSIGHHLKFEQNLINFFGGLYLNFRHFFNNSH